MYVVILISRSGLLCNSACGLLIVRVRNHVCAEERNLSYNIMTLDDVQFQWPRFQNIYNIVL